MKKNSLSFIKLFLVLISSLLIISCSFSPGVPGLKTSSSRYAKPLRQGVDYKLIVINAASISNQKPFNSLAYITNKRKRAIKTKWINTRHSSQKYNGNSRTPSTRGQQALAYSNSPNISASAGISAKDNKANYHYKIGKRDIISITVWDHPELTIPAGDSPAAHIVGNDGKFYFPYAGKIYAAEKTVDDVRIQLEKRLQKFITKPQVSVKVSGFRSQKAYISGAIQKPITLAIYDIPLTVRDAISKSGGVIPRKYTGVAVLTRNNKNIFINLNRMLKFNDNRQNFILKNEDRLHVLETDKATEFQERLRQAVHQEKVLNSIRLNFELKKEKSISLLKKDLKKQLSANQAKIFVMGEIHKPGSIRYEVEDGLTLAEAINDAGSFKEETVDPKGIFVVRKESKSDTIPTVYQLPLASVHSLFFAEQFELRPRDIVYVTATPTIRWNRVLSQLIPSLTLVNTVTNLTR